MDENNENDLIFFTKEEFIEMTTDLRIAQKRTNKMMEISRLNHAISVILSKMGFSTEKQLKHAELSGEELYGALYDAYILAKYKKEAAAKKLSEMPECPTIASVLHLFYYEVQQEDPDFWYEMKERAGRRAAEINQEFLNAMNDVEAKDDRNNR